MLMLAAMTAVGLSDADPGLSMEMAQGRHINVYFFWITCFGLPT